MGEFRRAGRKLQLDREKNVNCCGLNHLALSISLKEQPYRKKIQVTTLKHVHFEM